MLCSISGEAPQVPVVSKKSGNIFERRLIEAYMKENGRDPVTNDELQLEDLIDIQTARTVRPRPPTLTSIPSLLSTFQNEWDALALETYTLRQQLQQTRQELSTALYSHDAAIRVISRLTQERDAARAALSQVSVNGAAGKSQVEPVQVDGPPLSKDLAAKVAATQERLSKTRRKRPVPDDWVSADQLESFAAKKLAGPVFDTTARTFASDNNAENLLLLSEAGDVAMFSRSQKSKLYDFDLSGAKATSVAWLGGASAVGFENGSVALYSEGRQNHKFTAHSGAVKEISMHPCGELFSSVGSDGSFAFYDLTNNTVATQVTTSTDLYCGHFHPDGHLFAAGGQDGQIKIFDVASATEAAVFDATKPIHALAFSENGIWLACAVRDSPEVQIWDLRKANLTKTIELGATAHSIAWDFTGQYLLCLEANGLSIHTYSKSSKAWSVSLQDKTAVVAGAWGANASSIVGLKKDSAMVVYK